MRGSSLLLALAVIAAPASSLSGREPGLERGSAIAYLRHLLHLGQTPTVRDHEVTASSDARTLTLRLSDGSTATVTLTQGRVVIDGATVGHYAPGGDLERAWQDLLSDATRLPTPLAVGRLRSWAPSGLSGDDATSAALVERRLARLQASGPGAPAPAAIPAAGPGGLTIDLSDLTDIARLEPELYRASQLAGPDLRLTVPDGEARLGHFSLGSGQTLDGHLLVLQGDADIFGTLKGNVATVNGDIIVHPGAVVTGSVLAVGGEVRESGGQIRGAILSLDDAFPPAHAAGPAVVRPWRRILDGVAGVAGVFITLAVIGSGLVAFARPQLEVLGDTVAHSFGRAFVVGLLGQILLIPTFGMLVVGLALTVVGIVLVPFAVVVYVLLAILAILGGTLGVVHAMGETWTRRRLASGQRGFGVNSYSYVVVGLVFLLALWLTEALFGWVPVAGPVIAGAAVLVTWLVATAGLGAALLSRIGLRDAFSGRIIPPEALTDEYLWATPQFGVPAVQRPVKPTRTPPPAP